MGPSIKAALIETYLDYVNNYLTLDKFAGHNGLTTAEALRILSIARDVHETNVKELNTSEKN